MISVLECRGIGERVPSPMLTNVTRLLDPARFRVVDVPWLASYGPVPMPLGPSFDDSLRHGRPLVIDAIRRDPNPVILLGYSGGAGLAGDVAAEVARGEHPDLDVRGVGLISDPRAPWYGSSGEIGSYGITGPRPILRAFPRWWISDPADVICCCPRSSPLRTIADQTAAMSLANLIGWGVDLTRRLRVKEWQDIAIDWRNRDAIRGLYAQARRDAEGYLIRGDHTSYATRRYPGSTRTYTEWLADRINEIRE
ncbi:hypothetical protein [Rhodococcus sp. JVH1]|uniref:hypothetical protein n=1 Tax=Rhodococcus sp. JVH1 TaxID=745408 RepID=UPI0005C260DB|nr:hypothetical protein [Rhodococcus sp. JVH1]